MSKKIDLTGQKFEKLFVVEEAEKSKNGRIMWLCQCDCGNKTTVSSSNLKSGKVKSCGCTRINDLTGKTFGNWSVIRMSDKQSNGKSIYWDCICKCGTKRSVRSESLVRGRSTSCGCSHQHDLTGQRFGRLFVLERKSIDFNFSNGTHHKKIKYICKCDCGTIKEVSSNSLIKGYTTSCGCYQKEILSNMSSKHGQSGTRLYNIWCNIKNRCTNKNNKSYKDYGERGITVCNEWNNFEKFMKWALENGYTDELTIERIDVNGNYCPDNCKWIPKSEQANNTRRSIIVEIEGEKKSLSQWIRLMNLEYGKYSFRYRKGKTIFSESEIDQIKEKLKE